MPRRKKGEPPSHFLDTNVILRFLIGDDPPKAERAKALMERVEKEELIIEIPDPVVTEAVWTLESFYKVPRKETAQKMIALLCLAGVRVRAREVLFQALETYASSSADFVDCYLAAGARYRKIPVVTFDQTDFKKLGVDWENP